MPSWASKIIPKLFVAFVAGCALASTREESEERARFATPTIEPRGVVPVVSEPNAPAPGSPCTTRGEHRAVRCGTCGLRETTCENGSWSAFSACANEVGECVPGVPPEPCGACGTRTCTTACSFDACREPAGACTPSAIELTSAGCPDPLTFRTRTCSDACQWSTFSATCGAPPTELTISASQGGIVQGVAILTPAHTRKEILGDVGYDCPMRTGQFRDIPAAYTVLRNEGARAVIVSVFHGDVGSATAADPPQMTIYEGTGIVDGTVRPENCTRMPYRTPSNNLFKPNKNESWFAVADSDLGLVGKFQITYGLRMAPGSTFTVMTMASGTTLVSDNEAYTVNVRTDYVE